MIMQRSKISTKTDTLKGQSNITSIDCVYVIFKGPSL